jgi:predicted AlkP superfamily pyrophosphatase or phosphodiesterase
MGRAVNRGGLRIVCASLLGCIAVLLGLSGCAARAQRSDASPLILVSFDGFRWDYADKAPTPNLHRLAARGVRSRGLIPSFPTVTFPNHYTLVTGLYPGHHGVLANRMYDPATGRRFAISNSSETTDSLWWSGATPLWVTAERSGKRAGTMFWPGSEAEIGGVRPTYWLPYDESMSGNARVDRVLHWLDLPAGTRPAFLTLYFSDTDSAGHRQGPDSEDVRQAIVRLDGYLGRLLQGLEARGLSQRANIVVVSDHGMAAVVPGQTLTLDRFISLDDVDVVDLDPAMALVPRPGKLEGVYRALSSASPHLHMYRRSETPLAWHYRDHPRIPPLIGIVDEGWRIERGTLVDTVARAVRPPPRGEHGYDPSVESMRGIFIAAGPAFKEGVVVPAVENVHVYGALASALQVTPERNDGDMAIWRTFLR